MTTGVRIGETTVYNGDCLDVMATLAAIGTHVDAIVTDPPYHLTSIVKRMSSPTAAPVVFGSDGRFQRMSRGFMGKAWDGGDIAFQVETWRRCYDLLKPGGYLLAFGGTRTYHRMACAIEDAGFEIRDMIGWLYGTGFPKSHDVSKAIDKAAGAERTEGGRVWSGGGRSGGISHGGEQRGTLQRMIYDEPATPAAKQWQGWGTALKPAQEPVVMARKPLIGTVAENVLAFGTGAINIDGCRVGTEVVGWGGGRGGSDDPTQSQGRNYRMGAGEARPVAGRFPANIIHDGSPEVLEAFPLAPGQLAAASTATDERKTQNVYGDMWRGFNGSAPRGDSGSAARFFYCAKASAKDRAGSKHPTVKPINLIRYLATLVTPPGGIVLDPFAGSGTLGAAWPRSILIERETEYYNDIIRRLTPCAA